MDPSCNLAGGQCQPCEGIGQALSVSEAQTLLNGLPAWQLDEGARAISKEFRFRNFKETMLFVNSVAWLAESQGHHPDLAVGYGYCRMTWTTHALGGLSRNDFICAAKVEALLQAG